MEIGNSVDDLDQGIHFLAEESHLEYLLAWPNHWLGCLQVAHDEEADVVLLVIGAHLHQRTPPELAVEVIQVPLIFVLEVPYGHDVRLRSSLVIQTLQVLLL
jgi:hypothetical protein